MPLIDLDSMSGLQLREEAKYWSIEPTDYPDDNDLKKAIESKREMTAARHPVTQADIDSGMAADPEDESRVEVGGKASTDAADTAPRKAVYGLKEKGLVDSTQKATVSRPTPGEPENQNKKAKDAQEKMEARDNAVGKPDPRKTNLKHTSADTDK